MNSSNNNTNVGNFVMIQRFVKSSGPKAYKLRGIWGQGKRTIVYSMANKIKYSDEVPNDNQKCCVNCWKFDTFDTVEVKAGEAYKQINGNLETLVSYLRNSFKAIATEIVADFIVDDEHTLWLIDIKAFKINSQDLELESRFLDKQRGENLPKKIILKEKYCRMRRCGYCEINFEDIDLCHTVPFSKIFDIDKHLMVNLSVKKQRGKTFDWLKRFMVFLKQFRGKSLSMKEIKICNSWFQFP